MPMFNFNPNFQNSTTPPNSPIPDMSSLYKGPTPVVTLTRTITDPANTVPTHDDCVPYMCGVDPDNAGAKYWCSFHGQAQSLACIDGDCLPYRSQIPGCQLPVQATPQPAIVPTAKASTPPPQPPITPMDLNRRLPNIVNTAPAVVGPPPCEGVSVWIAQNQGLVVAGLVGLAMLWWGKE